jgi:putative ATP-dependent endonuclease of the OLD family
MKIISFAVNNFRSINGGLENNRVNFDDSNTIFIFGQNNVGKSSLLHSYEFITKDIIPADSDYFNQDKSNTIELEIKIKIEQKDIDLIPESSKKGYSDFINKKDKDGNITVKKKTSSDGKKWEFETFNVNSGLWESFWKCTTKAHFY